MRARTTGWGVMSPTGATGPAESGARASAPGGSQSPPQFLRPNLERIPDELKSLKNWVLWVPIWNGSKHTKRPIQPSGYGASTTNPKHWSSFDDVKQAYERAVDRGYNELRAKDKPPQRIRIGGVGFVFDGQPDENGLVFAGVDFDKVISGTDIASLAEERIKRLGSYTEPSVSGTGLHVIVKAQPLQSGIAHDGTEMYTSGRFFTMTGRAPANSHIVAAPEAFAALAEELRTQSKGDLPAPSSGEAVEDGGDTWLSKLPADKQNEVVKHAALHIANNSKLLELTANGGNYQEYFKIALAIARSGVSDAENIFVEAASIAQDADPEEKLRIFFHECERAEPRAEGITVGTLLHTARQCGADFSQWKPMVDGCGPVSLADFYAYMPMHNYIFIPSREPWPASSVNARLGTIPLFDANGQAVLDEDGEQVRVRASEWLDKNKPVEQMTWAPGLPMVIRDRLISEGGWIERPQVSCFNLYRPPTIELGNPLEAGPWLDHAQKVFGADADHIVKWLAHRVQRPEEKINHALVFGGSQGIGKDTLLEPVKQAVGPWNFAEVSPQHLLGRFNGYLKSVILRVSEARDLGEINRFTFYDHMKAHTAAPPDVLRVDEKNLREYSILNCCGVIITTNHKTDGIYLPADDRRHFVAWSDLKKKDFPSGYWNTLWGWYARDGYRHVAAYLAKLDISSFDPKAPPPKTSAFWDIVDANRAPEDAELADVLDRMRNPGAVTIGGITKHSTHPFLAWITDRKNRRAIPHRLEKCGYVQVRNDAAKDGLWVLEGGRQVIYAKSELSISDRLKAASDLVGNKPIIQVGKAGQLGEAGQEAVEVLDDQDKKVDQTLEAKQLKLLADAAAVGKRDLEAAEAAIRSVHDLAEGQH